MKNALLALFLCLAIGLNAQETRSNIAFFKPFGLNVITPGGVNYNMGFGYERVMSERFSGQLNIDLTMVGTTMLSIKPEGKYFLMENIEGAGKGFYTGGFVDLGLTGLIRGIFIGLGPQVGYQLSFLDGQIVLDADLEFGVNIPTSGIYSVGFRGIMPGVSVGYAF